MVQCESSSQFSQFQVFNPHSLLLHLIGSLENSLCSLGELKIGRGNKAAEEQTAPRRGMMDMGIWVIFQSGSTWEGGRQIKKDTGGQDDCHAVPTGTRTDEDRGDCPYRRLFRQNILSASQVKSSIESHGIGGSVLQDFNCRSVCWIRTSDP